MLLSPDSGRLPTIKPEIWGWLGTTRGRGFKPQTGAVGVE